MDFRIVFENFFRLQMISTVIETSGTSIDEVKFPNI